MAPTLPRPKAPTVEKIVRDRRVLGEQRVSPRRRRRRGLMQLHGVTSGRQWVRLRRRLRRLGMEVHE